DGLAGRQQQRDAASQALPRGAVTVFHSVDVDKLVHLLKQERGANIGVWMPPGRNPINITTGLVVDQSGHIITRLVNLDPEDKNQDLTIRTSDGVQVKARLDGVDRPTRFAVLAAAPSSGLVAAATAAGPVDEGMPVKLFRSDLGHNATVQGDVIRFSSEVTTLAGKIAPGTLFSKARGALTLESIGLSPKNDSGIVETLDMKVVGMAQAGLSAGTAYVFPYEFLRGQVLARVLDRNGTVAAGWLGVVTDTSAAGSPRGAVIKEIQPQSTAEICGLQARDVIVGLDDYDIASQTEMTAVLSALPAGRKVRLRALRNQKPMEVEGVLGAQPIRPILTGVSTTPSPRPTEERLLPGFIARDLTSQLADYFGVKGGILVTEVSKGSPADRAGLVAGDVVVGTDDRELRTVLELKALLIPQQGAIKLRIYRNKTSVSVDILNPISPDAK